MGKVQSEDLRLNLIINGDAGHKEILSLQRSMKDAKLAIKTTEAAMRDLEKAGKISGNQYQALSAELKKNQETLSTSKARYDELTGQLSLTNKTINELRQHIKLTRSALNEAVPNTENWKRLHQELNTTDSLAARFGVRL